jgi:arabinogalactan endo-1,4-beta-galactosidase
MAAASVSCGNKSFVAKEKIEGSSLFVKKVENIPDDFILGMDLSSVLAEEASGVRYLGFDGNEQDVFKTMAECGVNTIRVRVWNDPYDSEGRGFGGGNNDIDAAVEIGKRAAAVGQKLLVDFHFSDFWADPGKQMCPRAWAGMSIEEKSEAAYEYVRGCLAKLKKAGVGVRMVQIGNETNGALAGETKWFNIQYLMQAGSKAVREVYPEALVALHFANPEKAGSYEDYAKKLAYYEVDYDVFASSYYPYWHGTVDNLVSVLNSITEQYGKKVMVMETSYAFTTEDTDFSGNTISGGETVKPYPYTVQGQAQLVRDLVDAVVNRMTDGIGVVYWEGAWISVGQDSWEANHEKWEKYGSGWASSYAAVYDPDDAGRWYGGCAVDNQAFFLPDGMPLESLRVFNLLRYGNEVPVKPDAFEDALIDIDLAADIVLPETVNAVMTDGSREPVPVTWEIDDALLERMRTGGPASYDVKGIADGVEVNCRVNMVSFNFLVNPGFETGGLEPWRLIETGHADELYVENKVTDSLSGEWHMHFWSAAQGSVEFKLEQDVSGLAEGDYLYSISIMGGDGGEREIYAYVLINGEEIAREALDITAWNEWHTGEIRFTVSDGQTVTVGIFVRCTGEGNGAWGKIDDAKLNSAGI